ncbi:MAG: LPS export ABC transporter permease LptG [Deltaproteobacteria bacterium]|nr:MAG: LPS export ABC transporter permease LptG [Deltaproteobacteria bacterium]
MIHRFQRHLVSELLKQILTVMGAVVMMFVLVDYLSRLDDFIGAGMSACRAGQYVLFKVPAMVVLLAPVCTLVGTVLTVGLMSRRNELVIMESGGVSVMEILKGAIGLGAVISLCMMLVSETLSPWATYQANLIRRIEIKKKGLKTTRGENIWRKSGDGSILHIALYHPKDSSVSGVSLFTLNDAYQLVRRVDAARGTHLGNGKWAFERVLEQQLSPDRPVKTITHDQLVVDIDLVPDDLHHAVKTSQDMRLSELRQYIRRVEKEGYDASGYITDWYARLLFPLASLLMAIIGAGIAVRRDWAGRLPLTLTLGLGMTFTFWILHSLFVSMGHGGVLPAIPAAAAGLVLYIPISVWLWVTQGR